mgnify:CR=1 FL=1
MEEDEYEDEVNQLNEEESGWGNPEPNHGLSMFDMLTDEEGDPS